MKKRIIIIICLGFAFHANCQIKVSFDNNCVSYNSALISKVMINILGLNTVSNQLENKNNIVFVMDVDSLGNLVEIKRIHSKKKLPKDFRKTIENYLFSRKVSFFICYHLDPSNVDKHDIINSQKERFKKNATRTICIAFPGELMSLYDYEKEKNNNCLSKISYLLQQIENYQVDVLF